MKLKDILERRALIVTEMRAITAKPAGTGGDLSAEQETRFDTLKAELETLERNADRQRLVDEAERRMQGEPLNPNGDERFETACRDFSLRAAIAGAAGMNVECGRERELSAEIARRSGRTFQGIAVPMSVFEKRVVTTAAPVAGPGSNIIATDHLGAQYIDRLRAKMIVRRLGARILSGLTGNVDIPKLGASTTSGWVAENGALTPADPEFTKVQLTPKHAGAITEFSRNMLLQSSPDIEQLLRDDFAKVLAEALDRAAIQGGGSNEPDGVLATSGVNKTTTMGSSPTWEKVLRLIALVEGGDGEGTAFATNPSVVRKLRSTAKVSGTDSVMIMESPADLAGYPLASSTLVPGGGSPPDHALIFGNWTDLLVGLWSELDILVNPFESTAYTKGNVQVRGMMTVDIALRHTESFAACVDLDP